MSDIFGKISIDPDTPEKTSAKPPSPKRRSVKKRKASHRKANPSTLLLLFFPLGLFSIYSLLGFFGVPYYLTHFTPEQISLKYNLNLSTENIRFNPYNFTLQLDNTSIAEQSGEPMFDLDHIELIFSPVKLLRMEFVCQKVTISSPSLYLTRNEDKTYNISPLLPGIGTTSENQQMMGFSDLPIMFSLNNIIITNGSVLFTDKPAGKTHNIKQLELQLPTLSNIRFQADDYIQPHFSAIINGSPITFKRSETDNSSAKAGAPDEMVWELQSFKLEEYANYLPFKHPFISTSGNVDGTIKLQFVNNDQQNNFLVAFNLIVTKFGCSTSKNLFELTSKEIHVEGLYSPVKKLVTLIKLRFEEPFFLSHSKNIQEVVDQVFQKKNESTIQPLTSQQETSLVLHSLSFKDGKFKQIPSNSTSPSREWTNLRVQIENFVSDEQFKVEGNKSPIFMFSGEQKDKNNKFSYSGTFNKPTECTGSLSIDNLPLQNLLNVFLSDHSSSIDASSIGALKGKLSYSWNSDSNTLDYLLSDISSFNKGVSIKDKKKNILTADELNLVGAKISKGQNRLGNVTVKKGQLHINGSGKDDFTKKLLSSENLVDTLSYDGQIFVSSLDNKSMFTMNNATLNYQSKGIAQNPHQNITLSASSEGDGQLEAVGTVKVKPFEISLAVNFNKLRSKEIASFMGKPNFITKSNGILSGKGRINLPNTSFAGDLTINKGKPNGSDSKLTWENCSFENLNFTTSPYHCGIGRVQFQQPKLTATIQKGSRSIPHHFIHFFRTSLNGNRDNSIKQKKVTLSGTDIQEISVTEGKIEIIDTRLAPHWNGVISDLQGHITNIHSADSAENSTFSFIGNLDGTPFTWKGGVDPFNDSQTDQHQLTTADYPLIRFTKQLANQSNIDADSATLTLNLLNNWDNGVNQQTINAQISGLKPSSPGSDAALPIAIMSNNQGNIELKVSTSTPSNSTSLSLFEVLTNNFQTKVVKGTLSPLLLTIGDYTDLMDNDYIEFQPGLFMLTANGRKTLTRYGSLLMSHPKIKLAISGGLSQEKDRASLHAQLEKDENERIEKENQKLFSKWKIKKEEFENQLKDKQKNALSKGAISENDIPAKVLSGFRPLLPEPVIVDNEMLFELAEKRLSIVRRHILTQLSLDEGRIEIIPQTMERILGNDNSKGVHVKILPIQ